MRMKLTGKTVFAFTLLAASLAGAEPHRVLFLGNSITRHGPKADIGWSGNWGMAASAESNDYVHRVTAGLTRRWGEEPTVMVENIATFERQYASNDTSSLVKKVTDFAPDLVILAIGENVPALKSDAERAAFATALRRLGQGMQGNRHPTLIVRSCFWANAAKDDVLRTFCTEAGGIFVDIRALAKDEANYARAERTIAHAGVGAHPGDKGMQAIAEAILAAIPRPPPPGGVP